MTAMIDYENGNREKKLIIILIGYSSTLGGTLSSDCLAGHSVRSKV